MEDLKCIFLLSMKPIVPILSALTNQPIASGPGIDLATRKNFHSVGTTSIKHHMLNARMKPAQTSSSEQNSGNRKAFSKKAVREPQADWLRDGDT